MSNPNVPITISPRVGVLLTRLTETPDLETALWKVLSEYTDLKTDLFRQQINAFESKWGMTFAEFSEQYGADGLQNAYSYEAESDFWEWEKAQTLMKHYEALRTQWM